MIVQNKIKNRGNSLKNCTSFSLSRINTLKSTPMDGTRLGGKTTFELIWLVYLKTFESGRALVEVRSVQHNLMNLSENLKVELTSCCSYKYVIRAKLG